MCCVNIGQWFVELCNRSPYASTRQSGEFLTGHALQIACRERGAVGICARGYAHKRHLHSKTKGQLMCGMMPHYSPEAWRNDEVVLSTEKFQKRKKTAKRCPNFQGPLISAENNVNVFSSRLSDSARRLSSLLLPTSMAMSYFNAMYAEQFCK